MLKWLRRIVARFDRRWIRDTNERELHGSLVRTRLRDEGPSEPDAPAHGESSDSEPDNGREMEDRRAS